MSDPKTWLLLSYRAGMNSQIRALAEALGWPFESRRLSYREGWAGWWPAYLCRRTLAGIDLAASPVEPPWPDLIITAGRRHEPVCRWIRERSEGRTKLVFVGRTWAPLRHFDLVITTPQYRLPKRPNVLENPTTLHSVTPPRLAAAKARWSSLLARFSEPRVAVLVGGDSGPYALGERAARRLARRAAALAGSQGTLMVTTSARTSRRAMKVLRSALPPASFFYEYVADDPENPYHGLLAHAEAVVVTGDSIAMLSEAVATGKPVYVFDLGTGRHSMRGEVMRREATDGEATDVEDAVDGPSDVTPGAWLYRCRMRFLPWLTRDLRLVHRRLVADGRVAWLGEPRAPGRRGDEVDVDEVDVVERSVARVREILNAPLRA